MYRAVAIVEVHAWSHLVGAVALDPKLNYFAFEYAPGFIKEGIELAPLSMPLADARQPFIFPQLPELTFRRLPAMLADALPDDFGNSLVNAWMSNQGVAAADITALDRLAYTGKRGMGALEFRPARGPTARSSTAIMLAELVESARHAVHGELDDDPHAMAALKQLISVGTSAGGARAKATIAWNPKTNEIRAGQFDVDPGFEHWILKFDGIGEDNELGGPQGYGRIEYAYSLMAAQAGIVMSPCRLLEESGRAHFMTKRFDRNGNIKLHTQTLCGMAQLDYRAKGVNDYSQLLGAMRQLKMSPAAFEQAFRRIAFNIMAANCDDHTKNISFILPYQTSWELAPAYDVTFAYNPKGEWTYQHLMSVNGKFADVQRDDLLTLGDRFQIGTASRLLAEVKGAVTAWPDFARQAGVSRTATDLIRQHQSLG
ncbi:MAG TPA: type II toxin-antitoxin system HipA family toxin [Steroidobacteraceae bacterium]|jgi:serine/threonine-protein kinase HipA|nr:type II toxin-antitoxin system HipA family toxin [Steroidobacteraceae bacterium]